MPGLAYIAGLEKSLYLPRRPQPRVRVPRSTVAIAMDMTTIYPFESPGGWHLIGRTPLWMFDQRREQPVFLAPGDSLTFQRIDRKTYDRVAREVEAGTFDWSKLVRAMSAALKVVRAGLFDTLQDLGRIGYMALGMPTAGAMDRVGLAWPTRWPAIPRHRGLEIGVIGPDLLVEADSVRVALVGPLSPTLIESEGRDAQATRVRPQPPFEARPAAAGRHDRGREHRLSRRVGRL